MADMVFGWKGKLVGASGFANGCRAISYKRSAGRRWNNCKAIEISRSDWRGGTHRRLSTFIKSMSLFVAANT
uniref:Uncharacterized protein n=1 Tax=Hyaloperonospora arabidopsidis (strain Emoy2) TaxID=559515 RepID=M4BRF5_HYAAE